MILVYSRLLIGRDLNYKLITMARYLKRPTARRPRRWPNRPDARQRSHKVARSPRTKYLVRPALSKAADRATSVTVANRPTP